MLKLSMARNSSKHAFLRKLLFYRSAITIFPPRTDGLHDFRIWSPSLICYAGYKQTDGTIIGDPATVEFTEVSLHK